jgi:hypothetical protein
MVSDIGFSVLDLEFMVSGPGSVRDGMSPFRSEVDLSHTTLDVQPVQGSGFRIYGLKDEGLGVGGLVLGSNLFGV